MRHGNTGAADEANWTSLCGTRSGVRPCSYTRHPRVYWNTPEEKLLVLVLLDCYRGICEVLVSN